ncbi:MAG: accessory gene regulator B family protein [Lachnospiraceae bacterium]|nr:accessory gene regulator B family protein [Lachnospiraceae bacterium]
MTEKCAQYIVEWLITCGVIRRSEYNLYAFAAHSFLMTAALLGLTILIGTIMGHIVVAIEIISLFMPVRKFSGGYHAKKPWMCLICSSIILCICIYCSSYITYGYGLLFITLMAMISLIINSPIDSAGRVLDVSEQHLYKKITAVLVGLSAIIILVCALNGKEDAARNFAIGIVMAGILQIPCLLQKIVQKN